MSWKDAWYGKRQVKLIAHFANKRTGEKVTWQELCDRKDNGHRFNGGVGANIYDKLLKANKLPERAEEILREVGGYSRKGARYAVEMFVDGSGEADG